MRISEMSMDHVLREEANQSLAGMPAQDKAEREPPKELKVN